MIERTNQTACHAPKPPWHQFGIRTLLLFVAVVGTVLGLTYRRSAITAANISSLRKVGNLNKDVYGIEWSSDRRRVALVCWEAPVEIRNLTSLALIDTLAEKQKIIQFAFSPDEKVVAFCENDKVAVIANLKTNERIELNTGNSQPSVAFSPDGKLLATGGYGTDAKVWRAIDGQLLHVLNVAVEGGLRPAFSPDGRLLAIGNRNSVTTVFEVATGNRLYILPKASSQELQFSPQGDILAVTYVDGSVAIWSAADGSIIKQQRTNAEELYTVDWSPDGRLLATGGLQAPITIWDSSSLTVVRELSAPEWIIGVRFSPDGMSLYCAGGSKMPRRNEKSAGLGRRRNAILPAQSATAVSWSRIRIVPLRAPSSPA